MGIPMRAFSSLLMLSMLFLQDCGAGSGRTIAFIPRMTGTLLWEPAHEGADNIASALGYQIYWNAALREDDVEGQIDLIGQELQKGCTALVIAPTNSAALVSRVREALTRQVPTVIIGSPLPTHPGGGLYYIMNDEEEGGRLAAQRVGSLLQGKGSIALIGIDPSITGILMRARSFEQALSSKFPGIQIVDRRLGSFARQREQQTVDEVLQNHGDVKVIVALNWTSAYEAMSSIESRSDEYSTLVIGFDPDGLPFKAHSLDSVIMENTREMGEQAVRTIDTLRRGQFAPPTMALPPVLVTRENVGSDQVRQMTSFSYRRQVASAEGITPSR